MPKNGGLGQFYKFINKGFRKKKGVMFLRGGGGVHTPMQNMDTTR